ncbi:MAG: serine/threonine-protein kinase [Cocleimonas sp.]
MKLSVLLIQDNNTSCDVQALLESKIPDIAITIKPNKALAAYLPAYDLAIIEKKQSVSQLLKKKDVGLIVWEDFSDLSVKIDMFLQLQRHLKQFPLKLENWTLTEVLHNSDDAIIYHGVNTGESKHPFKHREAAIKCFKFRPSSLTSIKIKNFLDTLNKRTHSNTKGLVRFYDGGVHDSAFYLVMEYLNYGTLRQALNGCGNKLPLTHALEWFQEIVLALDCVHQKGLIHRDLKIDNVLLRSDGSLTLVDYGISKRLLLDAGYMSEGELHCSPHYVSPEQISGDSCTQRSDIYSLGVIFYELLVGRKPYAGSMAHELMIQHVMAPVPVLPESLSSFQPMLDRLMAKNPDDRFCCAVEAIESLPMVA